MSEDKIILTKKQAKEILDLKDGFVHTFKNPHMIGLIGADHSKESIYESIENAETLELAGEQAQAMNHGLGITPKGAKHHSDVLFVATDMRKVASLVSNKREK